MPNTKEYITLQGVLNGQTLSNAVIEALSRGATKILCDKSKPYIVYQRPTEVDEELYQEGDEVYRCIRLKEIIDLDSASYGTIAEGKEVLLDMYLALNEKNLYPAYLLVKDKIRLRKTLGLRPTETLDLLFGAKIIEYSEVEDDTVLLTGVASRTFEPIDILITIKGVI